MTSRCVCGRFVKAGETFCPRDKPRSYEPTSRTSNASYEMATVIQPAPMLVKPRTHRRSRRWFRRGSKA